MLKRDLEMPARSGAVVSHAELRPLGVLPIGLPAEDHRAVVHEFEIPEHVTSEVNVVDDLDVVRLGAAVEEKTR